MVGASRLSTLDCSWQNHSRVGACVHIVVGIIPAHAGSTGAPRARRPGCWDHPRACGEHRCGRKLLVEWEGSSPRMRGAQLTTSPLRSITGIIPAYAGSTVPAGRRRAVYRDHPRIRGEHPGIDATRVQRQGLSPHTRGAPASCPAHGRVLRIIPAYAGSTLPPAMLGW